MQIFDVTIRCLETSLDAIVKEGDDALDLIGKDSTVRRLATSWCSPGGRQADEPKIWLVCGVLE